MMNYNDIAKKIIELRNVDLAFRDKLIKSGQLGNGYHKEMQAIHESNAEILNDIIDRIGYPTIDKVGKAGSEAAWLIIQHSIGQPAFMKKCLKLLEIAVSEQSASPLNLAYLSDRIAVFEGKPQLYGTSFDWDENGVLNPKPYDDLAKVNQRRRSVGLNTLEEQIKIMRKQALSERQSPPQDIEKSKEKYDEWRRSVGWIK